MLIMQGKELQQRASERVRELPGAELTHPFGADWDVYKVRGKVFMLHTEVTGEPIVILKATPGDAHLLREAYDDITPGYHMNKKHWITLHPNGRIEATLVEDLVTESYLLVLEKLPKNQQPVDPTTFGQPSGT
ncbi:putative DNA-binding protein (MmcQ/YjbR family) [Arthrobacter sp. PL16]|nr:putative DNA-binding protein (MmcQ/YjbR family) [Arthrobacter sp. PL16]